MLAKTYFTLNDRDHHSSDSYVQDSAVHFINVKEPRARFFEFFNRDRSYSRGFYFINSRTPSVSSAYELLRTVFSTVSSMRPFLIGPYLIHAIRACRFCARCLISTSSKAFNYVLPPFCILTKTLSLSLTLHFSFLHSLFARAFSL